MAAAAEWCCATPRRGQEAQLRDDFWTSVAKLFPDAQQNGSSYRLAKRLNASFIGLISETMLMALDLEGVCASSVRLAWLAGGRACFVAMDCQWKAPDQPFVFRLARRTTTEEIADARCTRANREAN